MGKFIIPQKEDKFKRFMSVIQEFADALSQEVEGMEGVIRYPDVGITHIKVEICGKTKHITYPLIRFTYSVFEDVVLLYNDEYYTTYTTPETFRKKLDEVASSEEMYDKLSHILSHKELMSKSS